MTIIRAVTDEIRPRAGFHCHLSWYLAKEARSAEWYYIPVPQQDVDRTFVTLKNPSNMPGCRHLLAGADWCLKTAGKSRKYLQIRGVQVAEIRSA